MLLDALVTAVTETAINGLTARQHQAPQRLLPLAGRLIELRLPELGKRLLFSFCPQHVTVLAETEDTPDVRLTLTSKAFTQLRQGHSLTQLIKQDALDMEGDLQVAQEFAAYLLTLKPDPEHLLAQYIGDVPAHLIHRQSKSLWSWLSSHGQTTQRHLREAVVEEWRLVPNPLEIAYFADQVSELAEQGQALTLRVEALLARAGQGK
ncbi:Ubiquinone biosynthesis accessory factor UbiJ [Vibrio stylophorae]|uniref:Ubiquinone biosynthesis accessory factor UbiJ n=1 Tax=Vibrio stylophorae TaxID=659351 RepID=A0ABN8DP02_9VIBR|nr:SCP2 sterol-binding domain-containing protein [Vibrio stylophorae]CAH0532262.1 Ubiquinone biosynthesis accessory factor UbiJ [Vibrio stylophorae]